MNINPISNQTPTTSNQTDIFELCICGSLPEIRQLITQNPSCIEDIDPTYGDTPLSQAALHGHFEIISFFLENFPHKQHSLDLALIFNSQSIEHSDNRFRLDIARMLLQYGAKSQISFKEEGYLSAFHWSIQKDNFELFNLFLEQSDFNVEFEDSHNSKPILAAAFHGRFKMMQALMKKGANLTSVNSKNQNAIYFLNENKHFEILRKINDS